MFADFWVEYHFFMLQGFSLGEETLRIHPSGRNAEFTRLLVSDFQITLFSHCYLKIPKGKPSLSLKSEEQYIY